MRIVKIKLRSKRTAGIREYSLNPLALFSCSILFSVCLHAQTVVYLCNIYTQLPGAPESPIFRFTVDGAQATLSYNYRVNPQAPPRQIEVPLQVLNDSVRSLVLGALTEGDEQRAPRYDVWVLDKRDMLLSSEVTRANDATPGRLEQRSGICIVEDQLK